MLLLEESVLFDIPMGSILFNGKKTVFQVANKCIFSSRVNTSDTKST